MNDDKLVQDIYNECIECEDRMGVCSYMVTDEIIEKIIELVRKTCKDSEV